MTPLLAQRSRTERSFERLYRRHVRDVYHYALAVIGNSADAEDVTQTTFMNAYRAFARGERPRTPHNWLIAIAHNVCRQRFRQSSRRPAEVALEDAFPDERTDEEGPSVEQVRRALRHLAFNQRAALVMRELEGRSYAEIAEVLETSVSAVETLIFRARRSLREQLEGTLTCGEAERAISRQLDGELPAAEAASLRAHLRECRECATFARSQRAQRAALKRLAVFPLPPSLSSLFGGGGAGGVMAAGGATAAGGAAAGGALGTGVGAKAVAVLAAGALVAGGGYAAVDDPPWRGDGATREAKLEAAAGAAERRPPRTRVSLPPTLATMLTESGEAAFDERRAGRARVRAKRGSVSRDAGRARGSAEFDETATATGDRTGPAHALGQVDRAHPVHPRHPEHPLGGPHRGSAKPDVPSRSSRAEHGARPSTPPGSPVRATPPRGKPDLPAAQRGAQPDTPRKPQPAPPPKPQDAEPPRPQRAPPPRPQPAPPPPNPHPGPPPRTEQPGPPVTPLPPQAAEARAQHQPAIPVVDPGPRTEKP